MHLVAPSASTACCWLSAASAVRITTGSRSRGRVGSQRLQNVMPGTIGEVQIQKNHLRLVSFRQFDTESAERGMNEPPGRP